MAPSRPGTPRTHGTVEERQFDDVVPLRHLKAAGGAATGGPIAVAQEVLRRKGTQPGREIRREIPATPAVSDLGATEPDSFGFA